MTRLLALLALTSCSKALERAHETLTAGGYADAARCVHQAGDLVARAVGLVVVAEAQRRAS